MLKPLTPGHRLLLMIALLISGSGQWSLTLLISDHHLLRLFVDRYLQPLEP